jgi:hypothetical protein
VEPEVAKGVFLLNFSKYKTEVIGISTEVGIADAFGLEVAEDYRRRADSDVVQKVIPVAIQKFSEARVPRPFKHVAEGGSSIDFLLTSDQSLSVKSNQSTGKVAPQKIGQPSSTTFWAHFGYLVKNEIPSTYDEKADLFRRVAFDQTEELVSQYWFHLFDTDYFAYFYNFLDGHRELRPSPDAVILESTVAPDWDSSKFSFSRNLTEWREGNTLRYNGETLGEFQIHSNRDCFKFRFNMSTVLRLANPARNG